MALVAPWVKMISVVERALINSLTVSLASLVGFGHLLAQKMDAAMDGAVFPGIDLLQGIDHYLRLLRSCTVIEVDQWFLIHFLTQNREVGSYFFNIKIQNIVF